MTTTSQTPTPGHLDADSLEMTTVLADGCEEAYERLHTAIPARLDAAMRAAGVTAWTIHRHRLVLRHRVTATNVARMRAVLEADPDNLRWQVLVSPLLDATAIAPDAPDVPGPWALVWDFSWPVN